MIAVIAIMGVLAIMGSSIISKFGPNYVVISHGVQSLGPPDAALWQLRRDFEKMVVSGTSQVACTLTIHTSTVGASTSTADIVYAYSANTITRNGVLLLNNVTPTASCPYTLVLGSGSTPSQLGVDFTYTAGSYETFGNEMLVSFYSYKSGPDATSVAVTASGAACDLATNNSAATIGGTSLTGATLVSFGGNVAASSLSVVSDVLLSFMTPTHGTDLVSVAVTTPEGVSTRQYVFRYVTLSAYTGVTAGGGDAITITGKGLTGATSVTFGGVAGTSFSVDSDTQISVTTPTAQSAGTVDVVINGISPSCTLSSTYTFI